MQGVVSSCRIPRDVRGAPKHDIEVQRHKHSRRSAHVDYLALPAVPQCKSPAFASPLGMLLDGVFLSGGLSEELWCSLAPLAVFCSQSNSGYKGLRTNHRCLDQLPAANTRWRHQAVVESAVHLRERILFNLIARPKAPGDFHSAENPSHCQVQNGSAVPQKPTEYSPRLSPTWII